jgi:hypothetical protein
MRTVPVCPPATRRTRSGPRAVVAAALLCGVLAACSSERGGSTEAFCSELERELPALNGNVVYDGQRQRESVVVAYERVGEAAPSEIADDWARLTELMAEVAATDMGDEDAFGEVFAKILQNDYFLASQRVVAFANEHCDVDLPSPQVAATPVPGTGETGTGETGTGETGTG